MSVLGKVPTVNILPPKLDPQCRWTIGQNDFLFITEFVDN